MKKDYFSKSIEFKAISKQMSTFDLIKLNHDFISGIPKHLYKYRKSGNQGRIDFYVKDRKIYIASFNKLGEEFEGITPATKNRILKFDGVELCKYYKDTILAILNEKFKTLDLKKRKYFLILF